MNLSARALNSVASVNDFEATTQLEISQGSSPQTIYLQLVDLNKDRIGQGFNPAGRRFVPVANSLVEITLTNIDDSKRLTRTASQPFPGDGSIWSIPLLATDPELLGTINVSVKVIENRNTSTERVLQGYARAAILVY